MSFVAEKKHPTKDLILKKYTKKAFYKAAWDEETINARGHVFDLEGNPVNAPFKKFFNMNEHPSTLDQGWAEEMANRPDDFVISKKYNGHLCILFYDGEEWINTTSGSFEHEFIEPDREILRQSGYTDEWLNDNIPKDVTLMFEIIASYDEHLMYHDHHAEFGGDVAVFLCASSISGEEYMNLNAIEMFEKPKAKTWSLREFLLYEYGAIVGDSSDMLDLLHRMKEEEGTEGYIITDTKTKERMKIKTDWFIRERYKFQFDGTKTKKIFIQYPNPEDAFALIPEELHEQYQGILDIYDEFLLLTEERLMGVVFALYKYYKDRQTMKKAISSYEGIEESDKRVFYSYVDGKDIAPLVRKVFSERFENFDLV